MVAPHSVDIRSGTETDLPEIAGILRNTPWEKSDYVERQLSHGSVDVAVENEEMAGLIVSNQEFFSKPYIWLVIVDVGHRRKGIATKLFETVEARCVGKRLYTSTNRSNHTMRAFLERRGYAVVGEVDLDPGDPEVFYCADL
jgi:GNAT superfamily N-acetyltransferase